MKRFPFKRHLIILVPCILLIGAIVPLATFAASPARQASSEQTTTVTVKNRCVIEGRQTLVTLKSGQEIKGSAVMKGNDTNHEEEALALYEVNGPSAILVKANFGAKNFEFTASQNNLQVVVCFAQTAGDDDGDFSAPQAAYDAAHPASVRFEIEPANTTDNDETSSQT